MNTSNQEPIGYQNPAFLPPEQVRKIAVLRANAVGDLIVALPALEALRKHFPCAEIVLLGRHWHSAFLSGRPGPIDRVVVVPFTSGIYDPPAGVDVDAGACERFLVQMRRERFDLAFQLHGGGAHSNPFVNSLGARMTLGAKTQNATALDRWVPYRDYQHEALRLLEVVSLAGATHVNLDARLGVTEDDLQEAGEEVPDDGRPIAVLDPGSRDPRRRWPSSSFALVGDRLSAAGARVVINRDPLDASPAEETRSRMNTDGECHSLSLGGLAGLLTRARLLVANDSGPLKLDELVRTQLR
jgi:ADP-heptose:LPS heptosyltransferase